MISLEKLRLALLSVDPYAEIDRLIRAELETGRKTRQVFDELHPLADEAVATPGMSEDGEEAMFGALDALTGGCHPDCQYKDPPSKPLLAEDAAAHTSSHSELPLTAADGRPIHPR